jgi:hypothetical protein
MQSALMTAPLNIYTSQSKSAKGTCIDTDTAEETGSFLISTEFISVH